MNDLLILAALLDGPQHGYALKKRIGTITGHGPMHNNLVYPLLKRFVTATWVSGRKAQGQRGQIRELYSLTPKGKRMLLARLGNFSEKDARSGDAFRLRVGLFAVLSPEDRTKILDSREKWLARRIEILATIARTMTLDRWAGETVRFLASQAETERKWLDHLRKLGKLEAA
jgi:DNA-binding PadR family transcriptional regulator